MSNRVKIFPIHPANPERICWGCDQYCAADSMRCGNGSDRTQHPVELFGEDWLEWGNNHDSHSTGQPAASDQPVGDAQDRPKD